MFLYLFEGVVWGTGEGYDLARVETVRRGWSWGILTGKADGLAEGLDTCEERSHACSSAKGGGF